MQRFLLFVMGLGRRFFRRFDPNPTEIEQFLYQLLERTEQDRMEWGRATEKPESYKHKGLELQFWQDVSGTERVSLIVDGEKCSDALTEFEGTLLLELALRVRKQYQAEEKHRLQQILKSAASRYGPPDSSCNKLVAAGEGLPERTP